MEVNPIPPCKACPERKEACHCTCERWQAYTAQRDEGYITRYRESVIDDYMAVTVKRKLKKNHNVAAKNAPAGREKYK